MGELAAPQPRLYERGSNSYLQRDCPRKSKHTSPTEPKETYNRSPSVAGVAWAGLPSRGWTFSIRSAGTSLCQRIRPSRAAIQSTASRLESVNAVRKTASPQTHGEETPGGMGVVQTTLRS